MGRFYINFKVFVLFVFWLMPLSVVYSAAIPVDVVVDKHDILMLHKDLIEGQIVRVYARVRNVGNSDVSGKAVFLMGPVPIGRAHEFSLSANGPDDEIFADFTVPRGVFNIRILAQVDDIYQDTKPENNDVISRAFTGLADFDKDSIPDIKDNCPHDSNPSQFDADKDGLGDVCDKQTIIPEKLPHQVLAAEPKPVTGTSASFTKHFVSKPKASTKKAAVIKKVNPVEGVVSEEDIFSPQKVLTDNQTKADKPADGLQDDLQLTLENIGILLEDSVKNNEFANSGVVLKESSSVGIEYEKIDWNVVRFYAKVSENHNGFLEYKWGFGDGRSSELAKVQHTFAKPGTYKVVLTVMDSAGNKITSHVSVKIGFLNMGNIRFFLLVSVLVILFFSFLSIALLPSRYGKD